MLSYLPPREFRLSDLPEILEVGQDLSSRQGVHMALATSALTVDRLGRDQGERRDALRGIVQAWDYIARQHGEDVHVEYSRQLCPSHSIDIVDRDGYPETREGVTQYGVLNRDRNLLLKLGQHGPTLTTNKETAAKQAFGESHLELVEVTTRPVVKRPEPGL